MNTEKKKKTITLITHRESIGFGCALANDLLDVKRKLEK